MAQKTRTTLATQVGTLIADNTTQNITPTDVRTCLGDLADSVGLYQQITRSSLQSLISGSSIETNSLYQLTDAISSKNIVVFGLDSNNISTLAFNLTDNTFGNYDISTDTFTIITGATGANGTNGTNGQGVPTGGTTGQILAKNSSTNFDTAWISPSGGTGAPELVTTKISLNASQLATLASLPVDIPDLPAPGIGYGWLVVIAAIKYAFNTTDYNFNLFEIITDGAPSGTFQFEIPPLWGIGNTFLSGAQVPNNSLLENSKLQITADIDDSASGDGTALVYITAQKIQL